MADKIDLREVRLTGVIVAYAEGLFTPRAFEDGAEPKYGGTFVLLPADAPRMGEMVERAAIAAAEGKFGPDRKSWGRLRGITKDPLVKSASDYPKMGDFPKGTCFVRAGSKEAPGFTDHNGEEMPFEDAKKMLRSGWRVNALLKAFAFEHKTGGGVSLGLNIIQPVRHVMDLGGRPSARGAFAPLSPEELGETV